MKFGKSRQGLQRYRCQHCGRCFCEHTETVFYGKRHSPETIMETLALLGEGVRISSISRVKSIKTDTIVQWLREAGAHSEAVEQVLVKEYELSASQLDGLWGYVGNKGEKKAIKRRSRRVSSGWAAHRG